jgi:streptogramin lyase
MNVKSGCQIPAGPADRLYFLRQSVWAFLILLCGITASLYGQTAAYNAGAMVTVNTSFKGPMGVTTDANGNMFVADNTPEKNTATVYELTRTAPGVYGTPVALPSPAGGFICPASITEPDPCLRGMAVDSHGNLWVAAFGNYPTTKGNVYEWVNTSGVFATPVTVGTSWEGPWGVAADLSGNVFVTDNLANTISKIAIVSGVEKVTTAVAANVVDQPRGIAVDSSDNIFVIDGNQDHFMELTPPYTSENALTYTSLQGPGDLSRDTNGNLWVSEYDTNLVREETAGSGVYDTILGWGSGLNGPVSVFADSDGTVLVSDFFNHAVKLIATGALSMGTVAVGSTSVTQTVQFTFTGSSSTKIEAPVIVTQGATGLDFADAGTGTCTTKNGTSNPYSSGSTCTVIVNFKPKFAGPRNGAVKLLNTSGTVLASALIYGVGSGPQLSFGPPAAPATLGGGFSTPEGVTVDGSGNVYLADTANNAVKEIPSGCATASCVTTLGGGFSSPATVTQDGFGNLYVADTGNHAVKQIPPACVSSSCVKTLGGGFTSPGGVAVDGSGNVFVSDSGTNTIYRMAPSCASSSCVITVVGETAPGGLAADGNGNLYVAQTSGAVLAIPRGCTSASCVMPLGGGFVSPRIVAVDASGGVYVADYGNNAVVWVPAGCASSSCVITLDAAVSKPAGLALDGSGNVYVTSTGSNTLAKLSLATPPSVSFASTHQGLQSTDSPEPVTVRNIGDMPLTFPVPGTGTNPSVSANFKLDSSTTCPEVLTSSSAGTLAAGTSCGLAVDFIPTTTGQFSGSVVLTDNNLNASPSVTQSMGLSGTGLAKILTPTVTVTPSPSSITTTQSMSVTVTLSGGNGNPVPTGSVSLSGPGLSTSPLTLTGGSAIFNIPLNTLSVGTDTVTANYSGDSNYSTAIGSTTVTVTKATPTMSVSANPSAITTVQSTVVTVSVSGAIQPTGTITLTSGGVTVGSGPLASGTAQITVAASLLALGADTVTASYSGDSNYSTATGSTSVTVTKATPTVSVSANPSAVTTVQSTVVTVSVAGAVQPTGTITLTSGGVTVGSGSLVSGTAQITVAASVLAVGADTVTASYSGDSNYSTANGPTSVTVTKATPTMSVSANPSAVTTVQSTVVTVSVSGAVQPTGTITLTSGGVTVGSGSLASGTAQITVAASLLALGADTVTASYSGDSNYSTATGSTSVTVTKATPTMSVSANPTTITTLQSTVVTVSVSGAIQPTGTITLTSGGITVGSGPLASGTAQITVAASLLALGADTVTASYSGDSNYSTATGSTSVTVTTATPTMSVSANPTTITTLQSTVVTVSVNGALEPTGTITLTSGGITVGSGSLASGTTQITVSASVLALGADTVTASYSGDSNYTPASTTTTVTVTTPVYPDNNLGAVNLGSTNTTPIAITFNAISTLASTAVVTQGAQGLDFTNAGAGSCDTNPGHVYGVGETCTVNVIFAPKYAGARYGAVNVQDPSGNVVGTAYIYGTGVGPQVVFPSNTGVQTLGGGFSGPSDVAVDANGNIYVADNGNNSVKEISPGCSSSSCVKTLASGFAPGGVAVDGSGNVYVTDYTNNAVNEIPAGCTTSSCVTTLGGGFYGPGFVAVDGNGNVYVTDVDNTDNPQGNGWVKEIPPGCISSSCVVTLPGEFLYPAGVAVDASGDVYVADTGHLTIEEIQTKNCTSSCVGAWGAPGAEGAFVLAVDASGNVYPGYMAVDASGNLYTISNGAVQELPLATPPSLSFINTSVGFQSSDSPQSVTLRNIGNAPLTFPVPATGLNPNLSTNFNLDASTSCPQVTTSSPAGTLAAGASCNLAVDFNPTTGGPITGTVSLTDNNLNASPAVTQSIALSGTGAAPTPIVPYVQVNGGGYQQLSSVTVNPGDTVDLGEQVLSGGSYSWSGPPGFNPTTRVASGVPLNSASNLFTLTYTNTSGVNSTQTFTITVNGTPLTPYIQVNGGGWQQLSTVTVNPGDTVNLSEQVLSGGSYSWSGPPGFSANTRVASGVPLNSASNLFTLTYTNTSGAISTQTFTITVNGTPLTPYIQVNDGTWQQVSSVTVNAGDTVNLGEQVLSGGSYSWSGPPEFNPTTRVASGVPLNSASNLFTLTYTNTSGVNSTQTFTITVNGTPLTPYIQVNGGGWQQLSTVTVNPGDTVNLSEQVLSGGSYSWSGPPGFINPATRIASAAPLNSASNLFTLTYTNTSGAISTQTFTITVNGTPLTPYIQVNGGGWQQFSTLTVNPGDTVNLSEQVLSGGSYSWTGPNGFSSTARAVDNVPVTSGTNVFTLTYTNTYGGVSTQAFTINVN